MKSVTIKFIAFAAFIIAAYIVVRESGLVKYLDPEKFTVWISGFGAWGPLVYILIYSSAPVFLLPGEPITMIGGIMFGPFWGVVYAIIGANIGSAAAFLFARRMGRAWVEGFLKAGRLARLDQEVEKQGWKIVAFTRLIPLFPYNLLNYSFGLTKIRFTHYLLATFVFMMPGIIAYVLFSSSILDILRGRITREFTIGVILVALLSLLPFLYKKIREKRTGSHKGIL
ncbi:MAG: TVP38/TMEM64 family protein [Deltaproteobacteria bacterium]|nr:TVP38/TMEM64 family protein [Deltaproteobacteria bacterium]